MNLLWVRIQCYVSVMKQIDNYSYTPQGYCFPACICAQDFKIAGMHYICIHQKGREQSKLKSLTNARTSHMQ